MRISVVLILVVIVASCGQAQVGRLQEPSEEVAAVNAAAAAFLSDAHSFDYAALRANATSDFEILEFGQRLDLDGFIERLGEMERSRDGRALNNYELQDLNTEIVGNVAYTTWTSPNWLESAIFVRSEGRWLIDRAASVRVERNP
jgi:hypothetical protein